MFAIAPGRKALVTGGASGFGLGVARRLLDAGAAVAIGDVDEAGVMSAAAELAGAMPLVMDVTRAAAVRAGIEQAAAAFGGLDTVVNSAGVFELRAFEEVPEPEWDRILAVNLKGTFLCCQAAMPHLRASGRGRIVNISSDAGKKGYALMASYVASKFGVIGLTESLAAEFGPWGVTVNAVCPSTVADTAMGRQVLAQKAQRLGRPADQLLGERASVFPLGRVGSVADVVDAIMFLVSDNASWISGESINIDGGKLSG